MIKILKDDPRLPDRGVLLPVTILNDCYLHLFFHYL